MQITQKHNCEEFDSFFRLCLLFIYNVCLICQDSEISLCCYNKCEVPLYLSDVARNQLPIKFNLECD
jgi:hypothetical protein